MLLLKAVSLIRNYSLTYLFSMLCSSFEDQFHICFQLPLDHLAFIGFCSFNVRLLSVCLIMIIDCTTNNDCDGDDVKLLIQLELPTCKVTLNTICCLDLIENLSNVKINPI